MRLHHLVYCSIANINLTEAGLHQQLESWRVKNAQLNITGLLLCSGDHILQVLEGDAAAVHHLYATIAVDPRHRSVVKLADGAIPTRAFAEWSMQFRTVDTADFKRFVSKLALVPAHVGNLLPLLESFMAETPLN